MGVPRGARYEAEIEREGVNVRVVVDVMGEQVNRGLEDAPETVAHFASRTSARILELIAEAEIPF
jgi:hypothetical protein